jgi:hypothetical protein
MSQTIKPSGVAKTSEVVSGQAVQVSGHDILSRVVGLFLRSNLSVPRSTTTP